MSANNNLMFRQKSVAHQIVLDANFPIAEIQTLVKKDDRINILYSTETAESTEFTVEKAYFLDCLNRNHQAINVVCEFKKTPRQYILVSRKMGESIGLNPIKDQTPVYDLSGEIDYRKTVTLANAVRYKKPIEQQAITHSWKVYCDLPAIQSLLCSTFHSYYSSQFNKEQTTIRQISIDLVNAYEYFQFEQLDCTMERVENIRNILPLLFVQRCRRTYLEMLKNWILVRTNIPEFHRDRAIEYINFFQYAPFELKKDASWHSIKNGLNFFTGK